jgi:S1-C subfamily serine protease
VELFQNDMLVCEASVIGGMSGGGTYYADGRLIGIIVGTNGNEGVSVAIPDVMAEYRSISQ